MTHRKLLMFPGQGAQYYGMGRDLFASCTCFREQMEQLDEIASGHVGGSVIEYLYRRETPSGGEFGDATTSAVAIFMVEYALARALVKDGVEPDGLLGASNGLCAAACVAGCLAPESAIRLLVEKTRILETVCPAGRMVAVLTDAGLHERNARLQSISDVAGVNFPGGFVLSAIAENLPYITEILAADGIAHQVLDVTLPYHSRWIDVAYEPCIKLFRSVEIGSPRLPIISCAQGGRIGVPDPEHLWGSIREPISFYATVTALEAEGASHYIDAGPGGALATLAKYALPPGSGSECTVLMNQFGRDSRRYADLIGEDGG